MKELMKVIDVLNWLQDLNNTEEWGISKFWAGKLDNKPENGLGVYSLKSSRYETPVGGPNNKSFEELYISILYHGTQYFTPTEEVSNKIYYSLINQYSNLDLNINDFEVNYIELLSDNEDVGTDDNNVYERVIEFKICYNPKIN